MVGLVPHHLVQDSEAPYPYEIGRFGCEHPACPSPGAAGDMHALKGVLSIYLSRRVCRAGALKALALSRYLRDRLQVVPPWEPRVRHCRRAHRVSSLAVEASSAVQTDH